MGPRRSNVRFRTNKIIGRLTYTPDKHKQKFRKSTRKDLASRPPEKAAKAPKTDPILNFGSLNVNGLGHDVMT